MRGVTTILSASTSPRRQRAAVSKEHSYLEDMRYVEKILESNTEADRRLRDYYEVENKVHAIKRLRHF